MALLGSLDITLSLETIGIEFIGVIFASQWCPLSTSGKPRPTFENYLLPCSPYPEMKHGFKPMFFACRFYWKCPPSFELQRQTPELAQARKRALSFPQQLKALGSQPS